MAFIPLPIFCIIFGVIGVFVNLKNVMNGHVSEAFVGIFLGVIAGVLIDIFSLLLNRLK
ncbi:hypothetical protein GLW05_09615 [Pontibacillus yanchengensis]|uniref:Uncharacterized protein n=1 Tax=Pontibacillus yanchengensis TaxID=462910 RepID=A0A6I4ZUE8_9BACI|nr:hypothetical protein [Pontibacillus yanchengensis]MYL33855.1 hypothetical protein [Pontibacillus yanchengensis]